MLLYFQSIFFMMTRDNGKHSRSGDIRFKKILNYNLILAYILYIDIFTNVNKRQKAFSISIYFY